MKLRKFLAFCLSAALLCQLALAAEAPAEGEDFSSMTDHLASLSAASEAARMSEVGASGALSGILEVEGGYIVTDVANKVLWLRDESGVFTRLAGYLAAEGADGNPVGAYRDGAIDAAQFIEPWAIAPYLDGFAVSDAGANVVRYVAEGKVRSAAGVPEAGYKDGTGEGAKFSRPTGLAADNDGNLYIADTANGAIRLLSPKGKVTTVAKNLVEPTGLCWHDGVLYVAETGRSRIVSLKGAELSVIAGGEDAVDGEYPTGFADGSCKTAKFAEPQGVAVAEDGTIYVADTGNSAVRMIKGGAVTTLIRAQNGALTPAKPRSIVVTDTGLLVTDVFARRLFTVTLKFSDVPEDAWYAPAVAAVSERGLISGVSETEFAPEGKLTRAMFVTILSRFQLMRDNTSVILGSGAFSDVPTGAWYENAVNWAAEHDITKGSDGKFAPNALITRQDLVTLLYRYALAFGLDVSASDSLEQFGDAGLVSDYARPAMQWAVGAGILSGVSATQLSPRGISDRAAAAQLFKGFAELFGM